MSQANLIIPTTGVLSGLALVEAINSAAGAIMTHFSGPTDPSTREEGFPALGLWADTGNNMLKIRNAEGAGWVELLVLNTGLPVKWGDKQDKLVSGVNIRTVGGTSILGEGDIVPVPPGSMLHWPKATPPSGWLVRDGSAISRIAYSALFAVIGTTFGAGDGSTTFNLPDDRGITPVGYKPGDSAFGSFGGVTGSKDATLVSHGHGVNDPGHAHGVYDPGHDHEEKVCNIPGGAGGNFAAGTNADYGAHTGTYHTYGATTGIGIYGATTGISIQSSGVAATDKNIQPSRAYLPIIKY